MAGNRRGFIGIFSPHADDPDSEQEIESEKHQEKATTGESAKASHRGNNGAAKVESDWDDVFGEAPRQRSKSGSIGAMLAGDPALKGVDSASGHHRGPKSAVQSGRAAADRVDASEKNQHGDSNAKLDMSSVSNESDKNSSSHHSYQSSNPSENLSPATIMNDHPSAKSALSASDRLAINDAIQTLREKLSFARPNANDTPGATMQLGDTGRDFVDKAMNAVQENPDTLPRSFDDERFADDVELAKTLRLIGRDLDSLEKIVSDTEAKISTSTFLGALVVHGTGKVDSEAVFKDAYRRGGEAETAVSKSKAMTMAGDTVGAL
jgi:hypothetical protein